MNVRNIDAADVGFVLSSWRESHKESPGNDRVPWSFYKREYGDKFKSILDAPETVTLGAYATDGTLCGYLVMTPGKRVDTIHWIYVKHNGGLRRRGIMNALLAEADVGTSFIYTLKGRKLGGGKTLDGLIADTLEKRGIVATYVPLKEWLK